jgi:hypothetical protein
MADNLLAGGALKSAGDECSRLRYLMRSGQPHPPRPRPVVAAPALVTLDLWRVPAACVPAAILRMALDRRSVRRAPGLGFAKLLGTSTGRTFTPRDADPRRWGLLATWATPADAAAFERSATIAGWTRISDERLRVAMRPLTSRGRWSRREPFGRPRPSAHDGPVAAITRARIAPRKALTFWRAVPPVSADLRGTPGLRLAVGIGEAPLGLQGTFSLWESATALREFAHRRAPHLEAIRRTAVEQWYAEELFARFAVVAVEGTFSAVVVGAVGAQAARAVVGALAGGVKVKAPWWSWLMCQPPSWTKRWCRRQRRARLSRLVSPPSSQWMSQ